MPGRRKSGAHFGHVSHCERAGDGPSPGGRRRDGEHGQHLGQGGVRLHCEEELEDLGLDGGQPEAPGNHLQVRTDRWPCGGGLPELPSLTQQERLEAIGTRETRAAGSTRGSIEVVRILRREPDDLPHDPVQEESAWHLSRAVCSERTHEDVLNCDARERVVLRESDPSVAAEQAPPEITKACHGSALPDESDERSRQRADGDHARRGRAIDGDHGLAF